MLRGRRTSAVRSAILIAAGFCALAPAGASAQSGLASLGLGGLPAALTPANPANSDRTISAGFDRCPGGEAGCPAGVIREMYERWRPLNAKCDHRAVFALTYLRTTEGYAAVAQEPGFFGDPPWVVREDVIFADFYFKAWDDYFEGSGEAPPAWQTAFEASRSPDATAVADLFLGVNAHINRDLSYTLAAVGLVAPNGSTRKTDHDKVNEFLAHLADPLQDELGRRYDPIFFDTDTPTPVDEGAVIEAIRGLREQAWRNAENLVNSANDEQQDQASQAIEQQSGAYAESILAANQIPGYRAVRDLWCAANLEPSFIVRPRATRLRGMARRGYLKAIVTSDGPADFRLGVKMLSGAPRRDAGKKPLSLSRLRGPRLAKVKQVRVDSAGRRVFTLRLTRRGQRIVARMRRARIKVVLVAPRGVRARGIRAYRR